MKEGGPCCSLLKLVYTIRPLCLPPSTKEGPRPPSIATGQGGNFLPSFASSLSSSFPYRGRAAPAPNPEDFSHHSSAHKTADDDDSVANEGRARVHREMRGPGKRAKISTLGCANAKPNFRGAASTRPR